jgi:hypothetical protein
MNTLLQNFLNARDALYEHCGFEEDWIAFPIEDVSSSYWCIKNEDWKQDGTKEESEATFNGEVRWSDSIESLKNAKDDECYSAALVRHRFFNAKSVYRGEDFTLIIGYPGVDGMRWLYCFDSRKEMKEQLYDT